MDVNLNSLKQLGCRFGRLFFLFCSAGAIGCAVGPAFGDAPTHKLTLTAETLAKTDCGNGECTPACSVKASLKNVGRGNSVSIQVAIWYKNNNVDSGEAAISLDFPALKIGESASSEAEAPGYVCSKVVVKRIEADCPNEQNQKCPEFYNVAIPNFSPLKIERTDVEGK